MKYGEDCHGLFWKLFYLGLILELSACSAGTNSAWSTATVPPSPTSATSTLSTAGLGFATPKALPLHARWIEVSLQEYVLRLNEGEQTLAQYRVATGVGSRPEYTTYPGVFELRRMYQGPIETAPGVFVTDILEFDPDHGNGIHSLPTDKDGNILDDRVGLALTAGCIRVAEAATVFDFASLGMTIWVH